ncbi:MAG: hypothetical protein EOO89_00085 [Pedobacter sp.]|nr:MAG: hypothetical protein EOO89_00085 [Pedobacter sp.]
MKLTNQPTDNILFKVTDLSGTYVHVAAVNLSYLKNVLIRAKEHSDHINALDDCEINFLPNISDLIKEDKDVLFKQWKKMTRTKGYCFIDATPEQLKEMTEYGSDIYREKLTVYSDGDFLLRYNTILDEDGAIMEYNTEYYKMSKFLKIECKEVQDLNDRQTS